MLALARSVYTDPSFDPAASAQAVIALAGERGAAARARAEEALATRDLPEREAEQHVRRAERGAERDEILLALEELTAWYRDLVVFASGAERTVVHYDRLAAVAEDATLSGCPARSARPRSTRDVSTFEGSTSRLRWR